MVMPSQYYVVKVHGEYFAQVGEKKQLEGYSAVFKLPKVDAPLGVIKGKLLMPLLKKKDPRATAVHTHIIDEITPVGMPFDPNGIEPRFQSKEQLRKYCHLHRLPINVDDFGSLGTLRDHVRVAKEEPENYPAMAEKHKKKVEAEKLLYELNADVFDNAQVGIPVPLTEGGSALISGKQPEIAKTPEPRVSISDNENDDLAPEELLS